MEITSQKAIEILNSHRCYSSGWSSGTDRSDWVEFYQSLPPDMVVGNQTVSETQPKHLIWSFGNEGADRDGRCIEIAPFAINETATQNIQKWGVEKLPKKYLVHRAK